MYEIFQKLLDKAGLKVSDVVKATGIRQGVFSDWKAGRYTPKNDKIVKIAQFLGVTPEYLYGQVSHPFVSTEIVDTPSIRIPIVGDVAAGYPHFANEEILDYEEVDHRYIEQGKLYGLRIAGDSMEPEIKKGSIAIVRYQNDADNGDVIIVKVNGENATCKRLQKHDDGIALLSNNPKYPVFFYTAKEINSLPVKIIGKVLEVRTKYA